MSLSNKSWILASLLIPLLLILSGCIVPNKELMQIKNEVEQLKQSQARLLEANRNITSNLESKLNFVKSGIETSQKKSKRSGADAGARVDSLQSDFQYLSGRFEELKYSVEKSSSTNDAFLETAETRMTAVESKISAIDEGLAEIATQLATLQLTISAKEEEDKKAEAARISPQNIYKAGLNAIKDGKTKEARGKFKQYLREYPEGPLANNAQFWIGESYYDEKNYERAILEFEDVIKKYPQGGKVPSALLKQGMSFDRLKNSKTAQALYKKLVKSYPKSDEAKIAKKKIKTKKK